MVRREGRREGKESEGINGGNNREGLWLLEKEKERKRKRKRKRKREREREKVVGGEGRDTSNINHDGLWRLCRW